MANNPGDFREDRGLRKEEASSGPRGPAPYPAQHKRTKPSHNTRTGDTARDPAPELQSLCFCGETADVRRRPGRTPLVGSASGHRSIQAGRGRPVLWRNDHELESRVLLGGREGPGAGGRRLRIQGGRLPRALTAPIEHFHSLGCWVAGSHSRRLPGHRRGPVTTSGRGLVSL